MEKMEDNKTNILIRSNILHKTIKYIKFENNLHKSVKSKNSLSTTFDDKIENNAPFKNFINNNNLNKEK